MNGMREYVVTLHNREDLEEFYHDMETPGGNLYIPDRTVDLAERRPISRNTHYMLSNEEASQLRDDPRVLAVELHPKYLPVKIRPCYIQTETGFGKNATNTQSHKNWGLLRCVNGTQITNWGTNHSSVRGGTIQVNAEGRNVDVVIVDGHINPAHPEYALNSNGTGGTRVVQYNWFQHNPTVTGGPVGTYVYTPYASGAGVDNNNHGAHVAGTVAGNSQGWARRANIYNINPYSTNPNSSLATNTLLLFDYIRAFHNSKTVNPTTGLKNPTICNNSWGYTAAFYSWEVSLINYRGTIINFPTEAQLRACGVFVYDSVVYLPFRYTAVDADVQDAINDGIIMVGAAGNDYTKIDVSGGADFNNFVAVNFAAYYYHRGTSPGSATNAIAVGAVGTLLEEYKGDFSNCGPRVDIFAPGQNIMSAIQIPTSGFSGALDARNSSYYIGKTTGTSMASPQVCGVLACALEIYPRMSHANAVEYIKYYGKIGQMTNTGGGYTDYRSLQGATNRYLVYNKERKDSGGVYPRNNYWVRNTTGSVYPRTRKRQTKPR